MFLFVVFFEKLHDSAILNRECPKNRLRFNLQTAVFEYMGFREGGESDWRAVKDLRFGTLISEALRPDSEIPEDSKHLACASQDKTRPGIAARAFFHIHIISIRAIFFFLPRFNRHTNPIAPKQICYCAISNICNGTLDF